MNHDKAALTSGHLLISARKYPLNSLGSVAGLLVYPIAGYLTDVAGRVRLIALAGYIAGLTLLLYIFAPSWHLLALGALHQGFLVFQFPPSSAIIADSLPPQARARGVATMGMITGTVALLSPYAAGAAIDKLGVIPGMRLLYGVMAAFALVSATVNGRFLSETRQTSSSRLTIAQLGRTLKSAYATVPATLRELPRCLRAIAAVTTLGFVANALAGPYWVVYAVGVIGLSTVDRGLILLIETAVRNLAYIRPGVLVDRHGKTPFLLCALLAALVAAPMFIFATSFAAILLIRATFAIATAFFIPASIALVADCIPRASRGRIMAMMGRGALVLGPAAGGTGGPGVGLLTIVPLVLASLTGGYLYTANPNYPWIAVTVITAISLVLLIAFVRDPARAEM